MRHVYSAQATVIALALTVFAVVLVPQCSTPPVKMDQQILIPTVVLVEGAQGRGSAVPVFRKGEVTYFLTAKHVVMEDMTIRGEPVLATIEHPTLDVALISAAVDIDSYAKIAKDQPNYTDRLYAIGYHLGKWLLITEGRAGAREGTMSAPVIYGVSGGAVLNARGELVGIVSAVGVMRSSFSDVPITHIGIFVPVSEFMSWYTTARTVYQ